MKVFKAILGIACLVSAFFLGLFSLAVALRVPIWFTSIPAFLCFGLVVSGCVLISKCHSKLSKRVTLLLSALVGTFVAGIIFMDIRIRHERKLLQWRAQAFLSLPLPKLLVPDADGNVGGYFVDTSSGPQNGVLGDSRNLIERYANTGRIRWSARIQGQFAGISHEVNGNYRSEEIRTNEAVLAYLKERNAILGREWNMGFWQFVEDTIEFNFSPPEIEEEDRGSRMARQLAGTWTNASFDRFTIEPNGKFAIVNSNKGQTNSYAGDWEFRSGDRVLILTIKQMTGSEDKWASVDRPQFRIIQLDRHNLVYEVGGQTNSLSRQ